MKFKKINNEKLAPLNAALALNLELIVELALVTELTHHSVPAHQELMTVDQQFVQIVILFADNAMEDQTNVINVEEIESINQTVAVHQEHMKIIKVILAHVNI